MPDCILDMTKRKTPGEVSRCKSLSNGLRRWIGKGRRDSRHLITFMDMVLSGLILRSRIRRLRLDMRFGCVDVGREGLIDLWLLKREECINVVDLILCRYAYRSKFVYSKLHTILSRYTCKQCLILS
jgi:hypothetical protein